MTQTVKYNSTELIVEYELEGKYFAATYYEPEEFLDVIVKSICVSDSDINLEYVLGYEKVSEIIDLIEL